MLIYVYFGYLLLCPLAFGYCAWASWRTRTWLPVLLGLACWLPIAYEAWVTDSCGVDCIRIDIVIVWPPGLIILTVAWAVARNRLRQARLVDAP